MLFATTVLLTDRTSDDAGEHYYRIARRYIVIMMFVQVWVVFVDLALGRGICYGNLGAAIFMLGLGLVVGGPTSRGTSGG